MIMNKENPRRDSSPARIESPSAPRVRGAVRHENHPPAGAEHRIDIHDVAVGDQADRIHDVRAEGPRCKCSRLVKYAVGTVTLGLLVVGIAAWHLPQGICGTVRTPANTNKVKVAQTCATAQSLSRRRLMQSAGHSDGFEPVSLDTVFPEPPSYLQEWTWRHSLKCLVNFGALGYVCTQTSSWWETLLLLSPMPPLSFCYSLFMGQEDSLPEPNESIWREVIEDGKLKIRVTTWNTFMIPVRAPKFGFFFVYPQKHRAKKIAKFISESAMFNDSHVVMLQELWSPNYAFWSNAINGAFEWMGYPLFGRATVIQALKDKGFHYFTESYSVPAGLSWFQPWHAQFDSGCLIASKLPFEAKDVSFHKYPDFYPWDKPDSLGRKWNEDTMAAKGIITAEIPIKSRDGKELLGTVIVGNTHLENVKGKARDWDCRHHQIDAAREHLMKRYCNSDAARDKKCSIIVAGDWNTENAEVELSERDPNGRIKTHFKSSLTVAGEGKPGTNASPDTITCVDLPPTPQFLGTFPGLQCTFSRTAENPNEKKIRDFLNTGRRIELTTEGCFAEAIDQIFVLDELNQLDDTRVPKLATTTLANVERLSLWLKSSTKEQRILENPLFWIQQWNDVWSQQKGEEGVKIALSTAKRLNSEVISDHFPVTARVEVDFN